MNLLKCDVYFHREIWHKFPNDYFMKTFCIITQPRSIESLKSLYSSDRSQNCFLIWDAVGPSRSICLEIVLKKTWFVQTVCCKWKTETKQGTMTATKGGERASKEVSDSFKESLQGNWKGLRNIWESEGLRGSWEGLRSSWEGLRCSWKGLRGS